MLSLFRYIKRFQNNSNYFSKKKLGRPENTENNGASYIINSEPGNAVDIDLCSYVKGKLLIKGQGNKVSFERGVKFVGELAIHGDYNSILVGSESVVRGSLLLKGDKQTISIGNNTTFGSVYILCQEKCNIDIGSWCMFSRNVEIRTTDAHSVIDLKTRLRINKPDSIRIGNHVWVGVGCLISKGTLISNDSIVGAHSFVNKKFDEENVLIAGSPAKIVKTGVTWNRGRKEKFSQAQIDHWKELS